MKKITTLCLSLLLSFTSLLGCSSDDLLSVGVIGGADGPTTLVVDDKADANSAPDHNAPEESPDDTSSASSSVVTVNAGKPIEWNGEPLSDAVVAVEFLSTADYSVVLEEEGWYSSKGEVALYYQKYGALPGNYITKKEARALGWEGGSLEDFAPGQSIGGDYFGNYEGALPAKEERSYIECDVDTVGNARGAKRLIFSNDGLAFYTEDHYETFTLLTDAAIQEAGGE